MAENTGWKDPYEEKLKGYLQQMESREPFSFDVNKDAMYKQLRDNYEQQGKLAMEDTMGQAAALTGGYGNSYAQSVGQQVYNQHMQQLSDTVPELYGMALDRYQQEGKDLQAKYDFYKGLSDESYNKYLLENGLVSSGTETSYDQFTDAALDGYKQKMSDAYEEGGKFEGLISVFTDMANTNHDPMKSAEIVLEWAKQNGVALTSDDWENLAESMARKGLSENEILSFLASWQEVFKYAAENPYMSPIGTQIPSGSGVNWGNGKWKNETR